MVPKSFEGKPSLHSFTVCTAVVLSRRPRENVNLCLELWKNEEPINPILQSHYYCTRESPYDRNFSYFGFSLWHWLLAWNAVILAAFQELLPL